jgi:uncharacterized membrane protein
MRTLSRRKLLKTINAERVMKAIEDAEHRTSGEIRVSVSTYFWGNVRRVAEKAFARLGMTRTRQRNAVLFFIVPLRRRFVVLGDEGIHAKVGQEFWESLSEILSEEFHKGEFTEGLVQAIEKAGEILAIHFPYDAATDINELPDTIDFEEPTNKK